MHILIVGNGIAGVTAAIRIRKLSDHQITIISGESDFFYARTALMYIHLGQLQKKDIIPYDDWFWKENQISLIKDWVNAIDFANKSVSLASGSTISFDILLLATGSKTNFQNWPGQDLKGVHGFYDLADLHNIESVSIPGKNAVIVGGGLVGVELAEMMHTRGMKVSILVRDNQYWGKNLPAEEARLIEKRLTENGIDIRLKTTLQSLESDEHGHVNAALTTRGERIPCTFAGITTGVVPHITLAKKSGIRTNKGIVVNEYLETSQPDIFAAGDCAELDFGERKVEQLWFTGRMQGEIAALNICGKRTKYDRGIPFNAAKFFDLELQTYGQVIPDSNEISNSFFWQNGSGTASLRLNYVNNKTRTIRGFIGLGIRLRQEVCETWIREQKSLQFVLNHLWEINFDQELQQRYEIDILQAAQLIFPEMTLSVRKKKFGWF